MTADAVTRWLRIAAEPPIVQRAIRTSLLIGTILVVINHWDSLLAAELPPGRLLKMGLTYLVPYAVSTWASVAATVSARGTVTEIPNKQRDR